MNTTAGLMYDVSDRNVNQEFFVLFPRQEPTHTSCQPNTKAKIGKREAALAGISRVDFCIFACVSTNNPGGNS
jgi:hypothetical protein